MEQVCRRLKVPGECRDLAFMTARELGHLGRVFSMCSSDIVDLLVRNDGLRKPQRFLELLRAAECAQCGRAGIA
ncbi:hypothetical protein QN347_20740, partial [Sphingomonas sp. 10B4]|nr:hypothetical protein [Sphingomonas sp. 10B4]